MRKACIVFVCEFGMHRSRTAEVLFKPFFSCTRSCGVNPFSSRPCHAMLFEDADVILVMEAWHAARLPRRVRDKVVVLDIPSLPFMHPLLVQLLAERVPRALREQGLVDAREEALMREMILRKAGREDSRGEDDSGEDRLRGGGKGVEGEGG